MKKIITLLLFTIAFAFSADVKPFYFENVANDSASQQAEFDYMLKYKLFGRDYITIGNDVEIPDKSGWNGTAGNFSADPRLVLGGPVLVGGDIVLKDQPKLATGPVRAKSFTMGNDNNVSVLAGTYCLDNTNVNDIVKNVIKRSEGVLAESNSEECTEVPMPPVGLSVPTIEWPDTMSQSIVFTTNDEVQRIIVPDGEYEDAYDIYLNDITYNLNNQKLVIQMQEGGRLTRIYVKNFTYHDHGEIQVEYRGEDGDRLLSPKEYRGNVLIYTDKDISISNSDNKIMEGTIISTGKIYLACNINLAGQLIANQLVIGNTYHGENFIFMPFDKKIIDIDPEINKNGGLIENDSTVAFPIKLSDTASVDVYFSYCFELNDKVVKEDFNTDSLDFPVCGIDIPKQVVIKTGQRYPSDTIKVNVKIDDLTELEDTLVIKIKIESGAVLPGDKTEGILKIKITDAVNNNTAPVIDTTAKFDPYLENQLIPPTTGIVGKVKVIDDDTTKVRYSLEDTTGLFYIDSITGNVITNHVFDYETEDTVYTVFVKVTDGEFTDSAYYEIKIGNVNEPISLNVDLSKIYEGPVDSIGGIAIGKVTGTDADSVSVSYTLVDKTNTFKLDENGNLYVVKDIDYETQNKYTLTVKAVSEDGSMKDTTFIVDILNVNEPVHVNDTTFSIDENKKGEIGKVTAWDEDNDHIYYTLSDTSNYSILDGIITLKNPIDYEEKTSDTLTVYVEDGNNMKDSATIVVKVNNVNEGITAVETIDKINENIEIGTIVGMVTAKDSDNVAVTYKINIDEFKIDPVTGVITTNSIMDYEKQHEYPVIVTVVSEDNSKKEIPFTITLTDVNESPVLKDSELKIDENKTGEAGIITVYDEDKNPNFLKNELSIIEGDTAKFALDGNKVIVKEPLDYEQDSVYSIIVKVQDVTDPTLIDTMTYIIKVNNVPEKPEVSDIVANVDENKIGVIDTLKAFDPDGDSLKYEVIDNTNITVDSNGVVTIVKPFDYESDSIIIAHIVVTDPTGLKDTAIVSLKINDVNEPHTVSNETITISEFDTVGTKIDTVKVTDPDLNPIHKFELIDTTNTFKIDDNGVITIIKPIDYETIPEYTLKVIVSDSLFSDTAIVTVKVKDELEKSDVDIIHVDTRDSVYTDTDKPIYTNDTRIDITYTVDDKRKDTTITGLKEGENKIEICDIGVGKDTKDCDTVTVWYSEATPVITVATIDNNKTNINNITIIDEPDGNQYVNNKNPEIKVTVKDPTNSKKDTTFTIEVDLKTVDVPVKALTNKTIEPLSEELIQDAKHEVIGKDSIKVFYYDSVADAIVSYITDSEGKHLSEEFTVSYIEKIDGQDVVISYTTDSYVEVKSNYSISYSVPQGKDTITVSYQVDSEGKIQKIDGHIGYNISYSYTNEYGNTGKSEINVVLDDVPPKVEIYKIIAGKDTLYELTNYPWVYGDPIPPVPPEAFINSSSVTVIWAVDGMIQDTLTLQGLKAEKTNYITRCYQDKANNQTCVIVPVFAKATKEIEISVVHPITEVNQDRVDSFYTAGGKYDKKKPIQVIAQDADTDEIPEPVGVGIKIGLALPILNQNGGMPTADDIVQTINGVTGIVIDSKGNVVTDPTVEFRDTTETIISVDNYIENYCTEEYKQEVNKHGIDAVPFYDMKYSMHVWIFNNNAEYVNDFKFDYTIEENQKVDAAGMLNLMVDWLSDTDGCIKAKNGHCLQTGAFIAKLNAKSVSTAKCTLNSDNPKGTQIKKTDYKLTTFGYKRPTGK